MRQEKNWWEEPEFWESHDPLEIKRELYRTGASFFTHLPTLAWLWLNELKEKGLTAPDPESGSVHKQGESQAPDLRTPGDNAYPIRLESNKVLWIRAGGERDEYGYRSVDVSDKPMRTDAAIVAALAALESAVRER